MAIMMVGSFLDFMINSPFKANWRDFAHTMSRCAPRASVS